MRFSDFKQYQPKEPSNIFGFICDDDFLLEESRPVWLRIFGGRWVFEKYSAKEFEDIPHTRLMEDALTPSLFTQDRILIVTSADKLTKARLEELPALQSVRNSSLRIVLAAGERKAAQAWAGMFPVIEINELKTADVVRWLVDRYKLAPDVARYMTDYVGTDLYRLHSEIQKLHIYAGARPIEARDVDVLILRSEQFAPYELDEAIIGRDYRKAVQVLGAMLEEGVEPLIVLSRIVRVWRQLFIGKSLAGRRSARDVATAALVPVWKAADFAASCRKFEWDRLVRGFRLILNADRALKTSTPNVEGYFDIMLWKMLQ